VGDQVLATNLGTVRSPVFTLKPGPDDIFGTAHSRMKIDGASRAIVHTGATFHTTIKIHNPGLMAVNLKDAMRTNLGARTTSDTEGLIQSQGGNIGQISELFHKKSLK
jgi:hypothetical protein